MQAMCFVYAAISYICMGDAESSAKVGTVPSIMEILISLFGNLFAEHFCSAIGP